MLIDTHAHLYVRQFDGDREETIQRAIENGVHRFYLPNIDSNSIDDMLLLEKSFPNYCFPMMGVHPCSIKENYQEELSIAKQWLDKRPFSAIGEIGIDLYWDKTFFKEQKEAFLTQMAWAKEKGMSIVIHSRNAIDIIIELLEDVQDGTLNGILHCFGDDIKRAKALMDLGFMLGIGGVLTYKNSNLRETLQQVPLDYLVLETDAPWLAPVPHRGKRNESAYIKTIASYLAEVKELSLEEIGRVTSTNAKSIFRINNRNVFAGSAG